MNASPVTILTDKTEKMVKKLCVFPNDPIQAYVKKGEIKSRYYNPGSYFDEVHIISLSDAEAAPEAVQTLVGNAKLFIYPIGKLSVKDFPFFFPKVTKLIQRIQPDVIRAFNPRQCGSLAVYAGKKLGIPTALSIHLEYDDQRKYDKRLLLQCTKALEWYALKNVDVAICVTDYLQKYAKKYGAKNCVTIYNKVYTEQFSPPNNVVRSSQKARNEKMTILSVGRLDHQKNQECLIRAVQNLDAHLILIGQGELEDSLKSLAKKLDISQKIKFMNSIPNAEIQQYYWNADIFALATHYEGFCIPILEAMAAGLPVVASKTSPLPEILADTGILVDSCPEKFEKAFGMLIAHPEMRFTLGKNAQERAKTLDGALMEQKEIELYQAMGRVL